MSRKCAATWWFVLLAHAQLAASGAAALAEAPTVAGPAEIVFDWTRERCARWDIPDTPARAWRGADGSVALLSGSEQSRAARGRRLRL